MIYFKICAQFFSILYNRIEIFPCDLCPLRSLREKIELTKFEF